MNLLIKPMLFAALLALTILSTKSFDFQMDDEEPPPKPTKKIFRELGENPFKKNRKLKLKSRAGKKARKIRKAALKRATLSTAHLKSTGVHRQIRLLHEKIDRLESDLATPASATVPGETHNHIPVEESNTVFKLGGYVKMDASYDVNQFTGEASHLANLRLRNLDTDARRTRSIAVSAKQTRISLSSETAISNGSMMSYIEGDFFASDDTGSQTGDFSRSDTSSLNSYNLRLRHAYGSYCYDKRHRIDIGQQWTLFYDPKAQGTTVEFNGPEATAQIRRPQIRYTYAHNLWNFGVSLESGATEYLDISPAFVGETDGAVATLNAGSPSDDYKSSQYRRAQNNFLGGVTGDGNQSLPDIVARILYEKKDAGHFSLGFMGRQLKINKVTSTGPHDPEFKSIKYGYGVTLGGRYFVNRKSSIFGQGSFGHGIGTYIFGLDGYGAAIDSSRKIMKTPFCYGFVLGAEHYWSDEWRSNLIFSFARANVPGFIPAGRVPVIGVDAAGLPTPIATTGYSISNILRQLYFNILWEPTEKIELGLEYAYFRRNTLNKYFGYGNRLQFGVHYKF